MIITYLAAPLSPVEGETVASNIARAKMHYAALSDSLRGRVFVADWILHAEVFAGTKDDDADLRSLGMLRNFKQIETCHEIFLVGPRISRGMAAEAEMARLRGMMVTDLTRGVEPPLTDWVTSVLKNSDW
jgi:hypothetical protein